MRKTDKELYDICIKKGWTTLAKCFQQTRIDFDYEQGMERK